MKSMMMMPPEIAQPQLPRDGHGGLEVGAEDRLLEVAVPDESAGVDVDRRHRLGLIDDEIAARFQRDFAIEGLLDLLLHVVQLEDRTLRRVQLDPRQCIRDEGRGELAHLAVRVRLIDQHPLDIGPQQIAQDPQMQRQVGMHQLSRAGAQSFLAHELPEPAQVDHVGAQRLVRRVLGRGAHDVARGLVGLEAGLHRAAQPLALGLVLDARRHADPAALGHVDQIPRRQRDVGREPRALGARADPSPPAPGSRCPRRPDERMFSVRGGSSPKPAWRGSRMSEACRNAVRSMPISMNAACMPGRTRETRPL